MFADEWPDKPKESVCVGLRLMSEADKTKARAEAERLADELHPRRGGNWVDAFNDALIRQVVALGVCDPNDVAKPTELLPYAEEQVRTALTSRGAQHIFAAFDRYETEVSPLEPEATAEDFSELSVLLQERDPEQFTAPERRLIAHVLEFVRSP